MQFCWPPYLQLSGAMANDFILEITNISVKQFKFKLVRCVEESLVLCGVKPPSTFTQRSRNGRSTKTSASHRNHLPSIVMEELNPNLAPPPPHAYASDHMVLSRKTCVTTKFFCIERKNSFKPFCFKSFNFC